MTLFPQQHTKKDPDTPTKILRMISQKSQLTIREEFEDSLDRNLLGNQTSYYEQEEHK